MFNYEKHSQNIISCLLSELHFLVVHLIYQTITALHAHQICSWHILKLFEMETKGKQIIVFLADENIGYRNLLRKGLKESGINAKIFSFNCEEKLMHYIDNLSIKPDIIFLSFDLQNVKAKQCLKNMRANKQLTGIPIIIFSACSYLNDINEAFNSGANLFIPKPIFLKNKTKVLETLFTPPCQKAIQRPNKKKFVLSAVTNDGLNWSEC
jgi:PleD family two-component response regulator